MRDHLNPDELKVPAYLRKTDLKARSQKKLVLTALDRKERNKSAKSNTVKYKKENPDLLNSPKTLSQKTSQSFQKKSQNKAIKADLSHPDSISQPLKLVPIGELTAYFEKIQVGVIRLSATVKEGDIIQISAEKFLFLQPVESMQIDRVQIKTAKKDSEIGLKVAFAPKIKTPVYKLMLV